MKNCALEKALRTPKTGFYQADHDMNVLKRTFSTFSTGFLKEWNASTILVDKKSRFQGRCCKISSPNEVAPLIQELKETEKSLSKASHPVMYAWRTGDLVSFDSKRTPKFEFVNQSSHDNGEGGAGARLIGLLERLKIVNVLVVVSRWYGGTPLGPARFRRISEAAIESLKLGGFIDKDGNTVYELDEKMSDNKQKLGRLNNKKRR